MDPKEQKQIKNTEFNWPTSIEIKSKNYLVNLKTFVVDDAPEIFSLINRNREHLSQFGDETSHKYPNLESVVSNITNPKKPTRRRFAIRNQNKELVGSINITPDVGDPTSAEIGYYLGSEYTGKGYMSESVKTLTDYAFNNLGCKRIYGKVVIGNTASSNVFKKCGFIETDRNEKEIIFSKK